MAVTRMTGPPSVALDSYAATFCALIQGFPRAAAAVFSALNAPLFWFAGVIGTVCRWCHSTVTAQAMVLSAAVDRSAPGKAPVNYASFALDLADPAASSDHVVTLGCPASAAAA